MRTAVKVMNVLQTAEEEGSFGIFVRAVKETGLDAVLAGAREITVFAPVDGAFEALSEEDRRALFNDVKRLRDLLLYHIIPGGLSIAAVMGLTSARTLGGEKLPVNACDGFTLDDARVVKADIACSNGIIHGIDKVLGLPGGEG